jgi:tetratricopeptide (TPR) repeat protein
VSPHPSHNGNLAGCYDKGVFRAVGFLCAFLLLHALVPSARGAVVLVLPFHNNSSFEDLTWIGESIAETLRTELNDAGQIALNRETRAAGERRLSLRPSAPAFTKATLFKLGQTVDADYLIYGTYDLHLPEGETQIKKASITVNSLSIELRKFHDGQSYSESGSISNLSAIEELLAFDYASTLAPGAGLTRDRFTTPAKLIRLDAKESYIRGLISPNAAQKLKWFQKSAALDPAYTPPQFELGNVLLDQKDYTQALASLARIPAADQLYAAARFRMGIAAYRKGDYARSAALFSEVSKLVPLNEVYNNLGAAEGRLNRPEALQDLRRAFDGDRNDPVYLYNLGLSLYKGGQFDESAADFRAVLDVQPADREVQDLLDRAESKQPVSAPANDPLPAERLKLNFDETAFKVLKAMLQPSK